MVDLVAELRTLIRALDAAGIRYALCGGMAMAVHGVYRATVDIDLLLLAEDADAVMGIAEGLGYDLPSAPMVFAGGDVRIRRVSKTIAGLNEVLSLDLLLVTDALRGVWETRRQARWGEDRLSVVSREGLVTLKELRSSPVDARDIERLREVGDAP